MNNIYEKVYISGQIITNAENNKSDDEHYSLLENSTIQKKIIIFILKKLIN